MRRQPTRILLATVAVIVIASCAHEDSSGTASPSRDETTPVESLDLEVKRFPVSVSVGGDPFDENVYLLTDKKSRQGVIVDPGARSEELEQVIDSSDIAVQGILNTHGHFDHTGANGFYRKKYGVRVYAHLADRPFYDAGDNVPTDWINGDTELRLGIFTLQVLHTPGHSPGSVCYAIGEHVFSGDTLFKGSIGRTPDESATASLIQGIKQKLLVFPADTKIYPGHDETTSIGEEMRNNPFLQEAPSPSAKEPPGEQRTARGVLEHYPSDVRSLQAWYGHPFMIGDTPVLPTPEVPEEVLKKHVGSTVLVSGVWYPGERWTPTEGERNMPMPVDAVEGGVTRGGRAYGVDD